MFRFEKNVFVANTDNSLISSPSRQVGRSGKRQKNSDERVHTREMYSSFGARANRHLFDVLNDVRRIVITAHMFGRQYNNARVSLLTMAALAAAATAILWIPQWPIGNTQNKVYHRFQWKCLTKCCQCKGKGKHNRKKKNSVYLRPLPIQPNNIINMYVRQRTKTEEQKRWR